MTLLAQSSGTIGAILLTMAVVAWLETVIPLHLGARASRGHLTPNLALTFITFATNVFLNAAVVSTLLLLPALGCGVLSRFPVPPFAALAITVLVLDFSFYVAHVAMHKVSVTSWRPGASLRLVRGS
jgi:sterol desaturase/sphingolipid hydroxylase (fatty acid hydroxylase superfamily)